MLEKAPRELGSRPSMFSFPVVHEPLRLFPGLGLFFTPSYSQRKVGSSFGVCRSPEENSLPTLENGELGNYSWGWLGLSGHAALSVYPPTYLFS